MLRNLAEELIHVVGLAPQADGALTSDVVSLKNANKAWVQVIMAQANAAQCTISVMQATDVAGTSGKAVTNTLPIWYNEDVSLTSVLTRGTAAKTYQLSATTKNKVVWFEIDPANAMDVANNFDCLYVTSGGSNAANILSVNFYLDSKTKAAALPNAIVD